MTTLTATSTSRAEPTRVPPELALLVMVGIWAVNFSVAKLGLAALSPLAFNALRFPLAAAVVFAALRARGALPLPEPRHRLRIVGLGLLGNVVYQQLFILGLDRTRAGTASVLLAGTPIITALLSAGLGHERVGWKAWVGASATMGGMLLVVGTGASEGGALTGDLLLIGSSFAWAGYTVGSRSMVARYGPLPVTAWTLGVGTAGVVLIGIPDLVRTDLGALPPGAWLSVAYAGALSIGVAYQIWYYGVRHLGNTRTAVYSNLVPVVALLVAWIWLNEIPSARQVAGAAVIIAGVRLVQTRRKRGRPAEQRPRSES